MSNKIGSDEVCSITGKLFDPSELMELRYVRSEIASLIQQDFPTLIPSSKVSLQAINKYRTLHLEKMMEEQVGELGYLEEAVLNSLRKQEMLSHNIEDDLEENLTMGQRLADRIASFGGSWTFIISFFVFILIWMCINIFLMVSQPFDPYPFILLNLILSCLAALQAPVIMMSQNRKESKDRARSKHDYQVNLKAEFEIQQLHEKVDYMMRKQEQRLFEIQRLQTEMLEQILERLEKK